MPAVPPPFFAHPPGPPVHPPGGPARPLVVTTDEQLLDTLLHVLAAAGAEAQVATGGTPLLRAHREAPLVLLGSDVLHLAAVRSLPRRPGVVVVSRVQLQPDSWATAVELGAERVARLPDDEAWLLSRASAASRSAVERGRLVVVGGSCGGCGASTLAAAVALVAAAGGGPVLLVDADPWGAGVDLLLGLEGTDGLRWPDLRELRGRVSGKALVAALPETAGLYVLAAGRGASPDIPEEALQAAVEAVRGEGWPVVVDLPRPAPAGLGRAAESLLAEADLAALVVPARVRAASAARLLTRDDSPWSDASLVVRAVPGGLSAAEIAEAVGRPVAAVLPYDRSAEARAERGQPPAVSARAPLGGAARRLLAEAAHRTSRPR